MLEGSIEVERYQSATGIEDDARLLKELFADADPT